MVTGRDENNFEIAITQFSFKNAPLLNLLKKRGSYIRNNDKKNLRKINHQLQQLKDDRENPQQNKNNPFKDIHKPHYAFITFLKDDTAKLAKETMRKIKNMASKDKPLLFG